MDKLDFSLITLFFLIGMLVMEVIVLVSISNKEVISHTTLDAVCKDKIPNTEFKQIDEKGNIVCKTMPEMQRLDHTNQFIYTDNGDDR